MVKAMGSKISSMETIVALLENYKNVYIGFEFSRQAGESEVDEKNYIFFPNDRFTTDLSFFITDFHPRLRPFPQTVSTRGSETENRISKIF